MRAALRHAVFETSNKESGSARAEFARVVVAGLSGAPKTLPCKYFYDARGSDLFEQITRLPEYYLTRVETAILEQHADDIARTLGAGASLIEFGSGSSRKTEILLRTGRFPVYAPIDVSPFALEEATHRLRNLFPALRVQPVVGDFADDATPPPLSAPAPRAGFFPGSTIGNFTHVEAARLLRRMADLLGAGARLCIGVDLRKDAPTLIRAYDDGAGVTAAFNLNLLLRMQRELGAHLDIGGFFHQARYNETLGRIEMHLVSRRAQTIEVAGAVFAFEPGETIHTENSYKYSSREFVELAERAGWRPLAKFVDDDRLFSAHILETA